MAGCPPALGWCCSHLAQLGSRRGGMLSRDGEKADGVLPMSRALHSGTFCSLCTSFPCCCPIFPLLLTRCNGSSASHKHPGLCHVRSSPASSPVGRTPSRNLLEVPEVELRHGAASLSCPQLRSAYGQNPPLFWRCPNILHSNQDSL